MSNEQPAHRPGYAAQIWWFILGLLIFGIFGFVMLLPSTWASYGGLPGTIGLATAMILLTAGPAIWAIRAGKVALGSGLLVGYTVAAVASEGRCVYLMEANGGYSALGGALIYLAGFALALVVGALASIISAFTDRRKGSQ